MKTTCSLLIASLAMIFLSSCGSKDGFKTTDTGLKYIMHTKIEGKKPVNGDILTLNMIYKTETDSILFNTFTKEKPVKTPLTEPTFKGSLEEGFAMMSAGDSATFIIPADSLFEKTFGGKTPPFVRSGSMLTFIVKMESFKSAAEMEAEENAKLEESKNAEGAKLANYLKEQNITASPTASGLYYSETLAGKGPNPDTSKTVSVHYTGKFLDGKVFDSSVNSGKPLEFKLGKKMVIAGWEEGISMMKKGGKATLVIPSSMGYGERGAQNPQTGEYIIPPYTPLMFEVELLDIKK